MKAVLVLLAAIAVAVPSFPSDSIAGTDGRAAKSMKIVYFEDYRPFSFIDDGGRTRGIFVDVLDEVLERRMGIPLAHEAMPWARAQLLVKTGAADAFCTLPTSERRMYVVPSAEPLLRSEYRIFTRVDHPSLGAMAGAETYRDLLGFKFCYYRGSDWARTVLEPIGISIEWVGTHKQVFWMIAEGRVDLTIASEEVAAQHIADLGLRDRFKMLPRAFDVQGYHLCVGKDSPWAFVLPRFEEEMARVRADGTLERILAAYR